jgi:phage shock protein C
MVSKKLSKLSNGNGKHTHEEHVNEEDVHEQPKSAHRSPRIHLYRSETNKMIAGVCGGLGEAFGIDPVIIRLVFFIITFMGGSGILIYLILWIVLPSESNLTHGNDTMRANINEMKTHAQNFSHYFGGEDGRSWWGILLVAIGIIYLMNNFGFSNVEWGRLWPIIIIIIGFALLGRR